MERQISDRSVLDKFVLSFCAIVEKHAKYIIVSGFVAIASGRARGTEDIDMILPRLSNKVFSGLHKDLVKNGFECLQSEDEKEIHSYLQDNLSVRYIWNDKHIPEMEVKFAKDGIDAMQLKDRVKLPLTGLDIWFSSINVNVAFKEGYLKSQKDIEDAKHLRIVYSELIDEGEIRRVKR